MQLSALLYTAVNRTIELWQYCFLLGCQRKGLICTIQHQCCSKNNFINWIDVTNWIFVISSRVESNMKSSKGIYIKDNYDDNNNHDNHFKIEKRYKHSVSVLTPCIQIINFQHTATLRNELGCHNIYFIVALHYNGHSQADVHTEDSLLQLPLPPAPPYCMQSTVLYPFNILLRNPH